MKHTIVIGIAIMAFCFFSACENDTSDKEKKEEREQPELVAKKMIKALEAKKFKEAEKYSSNETKKHIENADDDKKKAIVEHFSNAEITKIKEYAVITYTGGDGNKREMQMEVVNNEWKISIDKAIGANSPLEVAQNFLKALNEQDYARAKELGTENTVMMIGMIESMAGFMPADEIETQDTDNIEWGEVIVDDTKAVVHYTTPEGDEETIDLRFVKGEWRVDMKKE